MRRDTRVRIAALCAPSSSINHSTFLTDPQPPSPAVSVGLDALASLDAAIALQRQQQHPPSIAPSLERTATASLLPSSTSAAPKKRSTRMSNSSRGKLYRSRRKKYTDSLGEHVEALRREVAELQLYRRTQHETLYHSRHLTVTPPFARVVCEYFSLFEFGVPVATDSSVGRNSIGNNGSGAAVAVDVLTRSSRQASFLDSMVSPEITFGGERGVQMLLEQWERYSLYHAKLQFVLQHLDVVVADAANTVVSARAVLRVRFSRLTLEKVFPHVLWNEALVQRLIGREIEYPVGNTFYFGHDGKIHGYETEVDFVTAFTRALGSIQDALELVDHALIKQQHMIGEGDGVGASDTSDGMRWHEQQNSSSGSSSSPSSSSSRRMDE